MRIAIDFSTLDHLQMTAGHYRYAVQLVRGLAAIAGDQEFLLLGSQREPVEELRDIFGRGSRWIYRRKIPWRHRGAPYADELGFLRHFLGGRIALLHVLHNLIPLVARCPVIVTKHDLIEEILPEYEATRRDPIYRVVRHRIKKRADRIICISQTTAKDLERFWGIGPERSVVIHHGVEEDFFADPGEDLLPQHPVFDSGAEILVSPYNLEPRKNLRTLVESLAVLRRDFPKLKLVLFGRGLLTPEREQNFERLIDDLDLQDAIVRLGVVSDAMLKQIYRRADVFVFPSLYEGFGLPVLEALACGACVLGGDTAATAEVAGEAAELVDTSDPAKLAAALAKLLRNPERRAALRRAGPLRARQFPLETMVRRTWETYLEVMNAGRIA
ncbi:MAG: glycosyltransferase family 1 protein [Chthoniobacterales bacterium]